MKKLLLLTIIALIFLSFNAKSQYIPMLQDGNQWNIYLDGAVPVHYTEIYKISGDTIISGQIWKRVVFSMDSSVNAVFNLVMYLNEDTTNKKLYALIPGKTPHLYFDFNAQINDTLLLYNPSFEITDTFVVSQITQETYAGKVCNKFLISNNQYNAIDNWIEGIGSLRGIFTGNDLGYLDNMYKLLCFSNNNQQIYPAMPTNICYLSNIGITEPEANTVKIYPNPASDFIQIDNITDKTIASIYTIDGKLQKMVSLSDKTKIKINDLTEGIYIIKLQNEKGITYRKFIKQ